MLVDRPGVEPGFPPRQGGVFPLDHQPIRFSVDRMGVEPGLRPYHGRVQPEHLQTTQV